MKSKKNSAKEKKSYTHLLESVNNSLEQSDIILKNFVQIHTTFFSIVIGLYFALILYLIPQIDQINQSLDLRFNNFLDEIESLHPQHYGYTIREQYFKNDTINFEKITDAIYKSAEMAAIAYDNRKYIPIKEQIMTAWEYRDSLALIVMISRSPMLNQSFLQIRPGKSYIPYNYDFFKKIDYFLRDIIILEYLHSESDVLLLNEVSNQSTYSGENGSDMKFAKSSLESLYIEYSKHPSIQTMQAIKFFERGAKQTKQLSIYLNFYKGIREIKSSIVQEIYELEFKKNIYTKILKNLKSWKLLILFAIILIWNILIPSIFHQLVRTKYFAIIYILLGFIPYIFLIYLLSSQFFKN